MTTLTKSLHTVTATVNVARLLITQRALLADDSPATPWTAPALTQASLHALGYEYSRADIATSDDPTIVKIRQQIAALLTQGSI